MGLMPTTRVLQRDRVRLLLQEPTAQHWSNATLNLYIDEAQFSIATGCVPGMTTGMTEPLLASEAYAASVDDQELYSLPQNYHAVRTIRARSVSTEDYTELPIIDIEYARAHPRTKSAKPTSYFLWGEGGTYQLGMYPAFNSANGRIYVSYWRLPSELTGDSSALQIPNELLIANTYLAAYRAQLERGHLSDADTLFKNFVAEYQGALSYINQRQINQDRAVSLGSIGYDDTDRILP